MELFEQIANSIDEVTQKGIDWDKYLSSKADVHTRPKARDRQRRTDMIKCSIFI